MPSLTGEHPQHALLYPKHCGHTSGSACVPVKTQEIQGGEELQDQLQAAKPGVCLQPDTFVICKALEQLSWWIIPKKNKEKSQTMLPIKLL